MILMWCLASREQRLHRPRRRFGADHQARRTRSRGQRPAGEVGVEQPPGVGHRHRIPGEHPEVAGPGEALAGEVERGDQQRPVIGDGVLGVMLGGAGAVQGDPGAQALELHLQPIEPPAPAPGAPRQQHVHGHAALHRRRNRIEHGQIVAAEDRQAPAAAAPPRSPAARRPGVLPARSPPGRAVCQLPPPRQTPYHPRQPDRARSRDTGRAGVGTCTLASPA